MRSTQLVALDTADFARRVRRHREAKGLSQVELGGGRYSGSYISHLESGRRQATPEVITFLADRLGLEPHELGLLDLRPEALSARDLDLARSVMAAQQALRDGTWKLAAELAERSAVLARAAGRGERWWESSLLHCEALFTMGEYVRCSELISELVDHEVARKSSSLRAQALVLGSRAHRASGRLPAASSLAKEALTIAGEDVEAHAEALVTLISALAEAGEPKERLDALCEQLEAVRDVVDSDHTKGIIAWTLGNIALLNDDPARGLAELDKALDLINAEANLRLWARLHKAVATGLLRAGRPGDVADHLELARGALRVVGNPSDLAELHIQQGFLALLEGRLDEAALLVSHCLHEGALDESPKLHADAEELHYEILLKQGRNDEARAALIRAAEGFERAGALALAVGCWKRVADWNSHAIVRPPSFM